MNTPLWAWNISALVYARTYGPLAHALDTAVLGHLGDDLTGKIVADIGCGPGVVTRKLLDAGAARVVAVDGVRSMLRHLDGMAGVVPVEAAITPELFQRLRVNHAEEGFDLIVFKRSLYVEPERALAVLRAAWTTLAPGGVICIAHPEARLADYALGRPRRLRSHTAYHLFNRTMSRFGELLGGEVYTLYPRTELIALAERVAGARSVAIIPSPDAAFNLIAIHRGSTAAAAHP